MTETAALKTSDSLAYGFIFVKDIILSNVIEELRYSTPNNFVNRPIKGYHPTCNAVLTVSSVVALNQAVGQLKADGYKLVIYDAYRPKKATEDFIHWSEDSAALEAKANYYPHVNKEDLFELGYLSKKASHSRGSTLSANIICSDNVLKPIEAVERELSDGRKVVWLDDGSVDMGTSFDLFDEASAPDSTLVSEEQKKMRNYFKRVMQAAGFESDDKKWWQFTFKNEPFPHLYYDFELASAFLTPTGD